ncbi:CRISPR-associated protein, Csy4 family [Tolumonas auensis DSM 9187]|uniref:CRISPR-associated protein, Csy4 family n=1 Tax=Tolumonas auensis (strain DSM 9187 / NBRC 110442 / TA 4) TaxID=595494 RepID=C4LEG1_TOLAT|nr:type I-F CRISPR-associated endoribonuclease Cas6/Csy4 [Tolumonas auensis]ACQ92978.1 CRISPR-associated protein, Csy4 family [Tolumonas auensis DSM 9187]
MDHYLDIRLLPEEPEVSESFLLNALFAKLHVRLGQQAQGRVGVSFPDHHKRLGDLLRLHGQRTDLQALMADDWLQGLKGYTQCSEVLPIPATVSYRAVKRVQAKSAHNKRQRSIAKGWLTESEAQIRIPDTQQKELHLPFVQLKSRSNGQMMRVYVEHGPVLAVPVSGYFNAYGLSSIATIPWF